jgi:hypothetical protein
MGASSLGRIMGLKLYLMHAFKGCRQAALGFAPFRAADDLDRR